MFRRGFTTIEMLMTLGVIGVTAGISIPLYQEYVQKNDLNVATEQTIQALRRAQLLARAGENTSAWGVSPADGVLFRGESFAERDQDVDEVYPFPSTILVDGLTEVVFAPVSGTPNTEGEIIFSNLNGDQRIITIRTEGAIVATDIVAEGQYMQTPSNSSSSTVSSSSTTSSTSMSSSSTQSSSTTSSASSTTSSASSATTSASSAVSSSSAAQTGTGSSVSSSSSVSSETSSSSSSTAPVPGGTACEDRFFVNGRGEIQTTGLVNARFQVIGSQITYGTGGPAVDVTVEASTDGGKTWKALFGGADVSGDETDQILGLTSGAKVTVRVTGKYSWMFNKTYVSNDATGHIQVLRRGDRAPNFNGYDNQKSLSEFLGPYIDSDKKVVVGLYDAIVMAELGSLGTSSSDFQDLVLLVHLDQEAGSCTPTTTVPTTTPPRFKVVFERLENKNSGDATRTVFVGPKPVPYAESAWIDLKTSTGMTILDGGLVENSKGLAVERRDGVIRLVQKGGFLDNSKEIIDARIVFENASVVKTENDAGVYAMPNPFDGVVNDNDSGDEVTISSNKASVLFQSRVSSKTDGLLVYWQGTSSSTSSSSSSTSSTSSSTSSNSSSTSNSSSSASSNPNEKKITICHFADKKSETITVGESAWKTHSDHGDHLGKCEGDDDDDGVSNADDLCPNTDVDQPKKYLLFFRDMVLDSTTNIFKEGPRQSISSYTLKETHGCSCEQILDVAEGKSGYYFTTLPNLYLQLRSLLDFYVTTARKFGCSRSLLDMMLRSK